MRLQAKLHLMMKMGKEMCGVSEGCQGGNILTEGKVK